MTAQTSKFGRAVEFLAVAICTASFSILAVGICAALLAHNAAGQRDFVEYWAAGQQIVRHANPYDLDSILQLERSAGMPLRESVQILPNPPSALILVFPLGLLSPKAGELVWVGLLLACLVASVQMIRHMHGMPKNLLHLLAYSFAPVLSCLLAGQISIFILLGLVLFLRYHRTSQFFAGASLWLCLLKPHLFVPFGLVLILWIVVTRSYRIVAGAALALGVSSVAATLMDRDIWSQYAQMMGGERVDRLPLPCLGAILRNWVYPHTFWVQCLPAAVGSTLAVSYFVRNRKDWDWMENGSILMLISVFVAPYSWFMDQSLVIPALLHGAYFTRSRNLIAILALVSAGIEIGLLRGIKLDSTLFLWSSPAWLLWYGLAAHIRGKATNGAQQSMPTVG